MGESQRGGGQLVTPVYVSVGRDALALCFAACGFDSGAEIGVERGLFSEVLCKANPRLRLLCVDAWAPYSGYRDHVGSEKLESFYRETTERLSPYCATLIRAFSVDAARDVADGSLDFVYIDANHGYSQVTEDLAAWTPKVRHGGVVAGHDYGRAKVGQVKEAVTRWVADRGIGPLFVLTGDRSPSWVWVKH